MLDATFLYLTMSLFKIVLYQGLEFFMILKFQY